MSLKDWIIICLIAFIIFAYIRGVVITRREARAAKAKAKREANQALFFMVTMIGVEGLARFLRYRKNKKELESQMEGVTFNEDEN